MEHTELEGVDTRYFNSKSEPKDLAETVLPKEKLVKLDKCKKQFANFDTTGKA